MDTLKRLATAALMLVAAPAYADEVGRWTIYIDEASTRFGIPTSWIERVMRAESNGQTMLNGRPIRSRAGAMGLMQLMPATWAAIRTRLALGANHPATPLTLLAAANWGSGSIAFTIHVLP